MTTSRRGALATGVVVLIVASVAALVRFTGEPEPDPRVMSFHLRADQIGDGVSPGTGVRRHGVRIGEVSAVDSAAGMAPTITLEVDRAQLAGLTDSLEVEYAPTNLFGISDVVLRDSTGGTPLRDDVTVDLRGTDRVTDVTMGTLLRSLSDTALTVLTPELTALLSTLGTDIRAFTPLIEAMIGAGRAIADTQRYPASFLVGQYAQFFSGVASFADGFIKLIDHIYGIDVLRNDRERFDIGVGLVVDQLFPAITTLGGVAREGLGGYADVLASVLGQLASTVPDPARSHADLAELLDRLQRTFRTTPDGPVVGLDVVLRGIPGLSVPLLGGAVPPAPPIGGTK
ncbi:mammalian cell entry protein [Nocardia cyriacigeorgica]|uniref:Mammalian cell entry protein n=1 Tax=Nocardia cyriacigeorgica TaxID=135487 RepID=A0A5R8NX19_9NOCA|nr:mammalian cell entry protein [Nocardia cyriacigeorgica]TLF80781.1 mammalian cell entry protein [Nocardia cyriacigeorgica]